MSTLHLPHEACSRVDAHLSKHEPYTENWTKLGVGPFLRVSSFCETMVNANMCLDQYIAGLHHIQVVDHIKNGGQ